jgi:PAS domain S-box-containing protein
MNQRMTRILCVNDKTLNSVTTGAVEVHPNELLSVMQLSNNTIRFQQALMDAIPSPVFYKDAECIYMGGNKAYEKYLGLSPEQYIGKSVYDIAPVDLAEKYNKFDRDLLNNPGAQIYEASVVYADGTRHDVVINEATFTNAEGKVAGLIGVISDITNQLEAERQLLKALEEITVAHFAAEEANRTKYAFLANMNHELLTPLNSVIGFSEVLQDQMFGPINEKQQEYVHNIFTSGKHLLSLIKDMFDLSKVESGKMKLELSAFLLRETVEASLMMLMEKALKSGVGLRMDLSPQADVRIVADQRKLKQILFNLLSNAVKFTPAGGTVDVSAVRDGDFIEITVADTGIGIREEDITKLFHPFTQLESVFTKQYEGTGLGLALTRQLVELHYGRVWVESEFGTGSRFSLTIPIMQTATKKLSVNRPTVKPSITGDNHHVTQHIYC